MEGGSEEEEDEEEEEEEEKEEAARITELRRRLYTVSERYKELSVSISVIELRETGFERSRKVEGPSIVERTTDRWCLRIRRRRPGRSQRRDK